jgi:hypothetical protein
MTALAICAGCGKNVNPAAAYIREDGQYCPECNARLEIAADQARLQGRVDVEQQKSLSRSARRLAMLHGFMWACLVIILARGQDSWYTPLLAVPALLWFGLATRKRWALPAAVALDGLAAVAAVVLALVGAVQVAVAGFLGLSGVFLLAMTVLLREAFKMPQPRQADPDVPVLVKRR